MLASAASHVTARTRTIALLGLEPAPVDVELQLGAGLPAFTIVGLPDKAVAESRERVRAALSTIGLSLPPRRIVVNLAPGDLVKEGSHYDLPIALGLLCVMGALPSDVLDGRLVLGELGLDASIPPGQWCPGSGHRRIGARSRPGLPRGRWSRGGMAGRNGHDHSRTASLALVNHLRGDQLLASPSARLAEDEPEPPDLRDVKGQETAKRALEIAAAGGHNLLMMGPPGAGKSMLAARMIGILPPLSAPEMLEVGSSRASAASSVTASCDDGGRFVVPTMQRPWRRWSVAEVPHAPERFHWRITAYSFSTSCPEFGRQVLEALRQPMEAGTVTVARANHHITYPARFQLIAAMNPCRCGHLDDPTFACAKAHRCGADYQKRISGPLFDRIDLHMDVPSRLTVGSEPAHPVRGQRTNIGAGRSSARRASRQAGRPRPPGSASQLRARGRVARSGLPHGRGCQGVSLPERSNASDYRHAVIIGS